MPERRYVIPGIVALAALLGAFAPVAVAADPVLIPPAPQPVPPGGGGNSNAPVVAPPPVQPAPPVQPVPPTPPSVYPPISCPSGGLVYWYGNDYPWGLGYWRGNVPWGYRLGNPNEPLGVTSRRLDPQALPPLPVVVALTPQQEALRLLKAGEFERAAGALGVLVSHARHAATGALNVPPGSTPATTVPGSAPAGATPPAAAVPASPAAATPATPPEIPWSIGETQRLLAVALLGQKLEAQAVRAAAEAYAAEPSLCERRLPSDVVGGGDTLRRLMLRAVTNAQKTGTPDAWMLAGMMMQAQGRSSLPDSVKSGLGKHPLAPRMLAAGKRSGSGVRQTTTPKPGVSGGVMP